MIDFLNDIQGLIAAIGLIVTITIAIIGFCINKNISKISQSLSVGNKGKVNQAMNDVNDKSQNIGDRSNHNTQTK